MIRYIIKRMLGLFPVCFWVVFLVGFLIHLVPGDPADLLLGEYATLEQKTEMRHALGLDVSIWHQLFQYYSNLFRFDLGHSLIINEPVTELILERIPATYELAFLAICVALLISVPLGVMSYLKKDTLVDLTAMGISLLGVSIPNFWMGPLLILIFSIHLNWFPVSERMGLSSYVLPAMTLGLGLASILSRTTRNGMLDISKEEFVRVARAKGLRQFYVIFKHMLRNVAMPLVTLLGLQFGVLLTGAVITERIYDWPGLGSLMIEALQNRDYPLIQGCVLFFAMSYVCVNFLTDIVYAWIDPRVRHSLSR